MTWIRPTDDRLPKIVLFLATHLGPKEKQIVPNGLDFTEKGKVWSFQQLVWRWSAYNFVGLL